jgi:diguanylate cyclase (GGDEF)-like protein/PAS domain S-box-containing protein
MESARRSNLSSLPTGQPTRIHAPGLETLAARHALAVEVSRTATWDFNPRTGEVRWSCPVEQVLGYAAGTLGFRCWQGEPDEEETAEEAKPPITADVGRALVEPVLAAMRQGAPWTDYDLLQTIQGPEGELHKVQVRATPVAMGNGQGCAGVIADVTDRKDMEQALQDLIDRYRQLVDLSPDAIIVHQDGVLVYGNPAATKLVKTDLQEGFGRSIADFLHPDSISDTLARISDLHEKGDVAPVGEATLVGMDGSQTTVEATSVLTSWAGRPAYQVILRDISERRQAEAAMRYQANLVAHVSDAIIGIDSKSRVESWNPAAESIYGWSIEEAVGQQVAELLTGTDERHAVLEDGTRVHVRKGGDQIDVWVSMSPLFDDRGKSAGWVVVCTEITEARRVEAARRAAEERYAAVVAALEEGIVVVAGDGRLSVANTAARKMLGSRLTTGREDDIFSGGSPVAREDGTTFGADDGPIAATLRTMRPQTNVVIGVNDDEGKLQWLSVSTRLLSNDEEPDTQAVVCTFSDITERKAAEAQLNWQANHDNLTGLANRAYFVRSVDRALTSARQRHQNLALLYIDLDRFKMVNDSLGHAAGDSVLACVGKRLESAIRVTDVVSRLVGDEFTVLCRDVSSADAAVSVAKSLSQVISQPVELPDDRDVTVTASIGVAFVPEGAHEAQELIQDADVAMYRAKEKGRARVEVFEEGLRRQAKARLTVHEDLRKGIERDELMLQYQPLATVADDHVVGMEALVRWEHPTRGLLPPAEFIPVAEESDLIVNLGQWVLNDACKTMSRWMRALPETRDTFVSVNLSARQLTEPDLVQQIAEALTRWDLPARALVLEITESTLMADPVAASAILAEIRAAGVRLAIDDFGTGYSSLAHLRRFAVDYLKIDHSFIEGLGSDGEAEAIVSAVVELGHTLDLTVVAEGVETPRQLEQVRRLGCDLYQGFLLARPAPPARVRFR